MFVTVICGILDTADGTVVFANAGHNPPLVVRSSGGTALVKTDNGLALGVLEDAPYRCESLRLEAGDSIFLYTDGVTEAMNPAEELFGDQRLQEALESLAGKSPGEIASAVLQEVRDFAAGAPQSDDITILAVRFRGAVPPAN